MKTAIARAQAASRKARRQMRNLTVDNPCNRAFNRWHRNGDPIVRKSVLEDLTWQ